MTQDWLRYAWLTGLLLLAGSPLLAQTDVSRWPEVQTEVMVVDPAGVSIAGLSADGLLAQGTGKARAVESLTPVKGPQSVCLLLDGSDADRLSLMKSKGKKLLMHLAPEDEVCVAVYAAGLGLVQPFTTDRRAAEQSLEPITPAGGTHMRDAVLSLATYMRGAAQNPSRAIILLSDGSDHGSQNSMKSFRQQMAAPGTPAVHMVVLPDEFGHARYKQGNPKQGTAFHLTEPSGGLTYFPHTTSDMNALAEALPEALRTRYLVTFKAYNPLRDGHEERLEIVFDKEHRQGKFHVQAPAAYMAPAP